MPDSRVKNSTNVRTGLKVFRAALGAADRVVPRLAVTMAIRAFLRPPRARRPAIEVARLASASRAELVADRAAIPVWSWAPDRPADVDDTPVALLVHGWGGRGAQLAAVVEPLVARGWRVVTYDAAAHGDVPGDEMTLLALADTVARVAATLPRLDAIVAHSFGAAAATIALARGLAVERVAFVAPLFGVTESVGRYLDFVGLSPTSRAAFVADISARVGATTQELDGPALAPAMTSPLLVVHDRDDREVPYADGVAAATLWPDARLVTTAGLGHRRILDDADVVATVADFVTAADTPLPVLLDDAARLERDLADREARRARAFP